MADPGPLDARGEVVAEFVLVCLGKLMSKESGDMLGLDDMHGGAYDRLIKGLELGLAMKHHIGGIFSLHEAPMVPGTKVSQDRTTALSPTIEALMEGARVECIGQLLCPNGIIDGDKGIVEHLKGNVGLEQLPCQPEMPVEVDLQPERRPSRYTHVAQTELLVDEVEIVVQAFPRRRLEEGAMRGLIMPGLVRRA